MNDIQRKNTLALTVTVFMAVMFVTLVSVLVIDVDRYIGEIIPLGTMMLIVMTPILGYILFDWLTRTTVHRIYASKGTEDVPGTESDPFMKWLEIIFSKED